MTLQLSPIAATMLGLFLGFAQIAAEDIPDGIAPKDKRQIIGTAPTSSTPTESTMASPTPSSEPTSTPESSSQEASSETPQPTSEPSPPTTAPDTQPTPAPTTAATSPTSEPAPGSSNIPTTIEVTTTNKDGSTVKTRIATSAARSSDIVVIGSTTINRSSLTKPTTITSALVASRTEASTYTSFWTSNGTPLSAVLTTQRVLASTTGFATETVSPSIQNGGGSGSGSGRGLSDSSKKVIGGVVGGIGGAILVGGLAVVAWRLWGKKRRTAAAEKDPFMLHSQSDSIDAQQRQSMQNGLERYHVPGGTPNAASNF